jgi:hypothetical protein
MATYVQVPVREEYVLDVFEFVLSLEGRATAAPAALRDPQISPGANGDGDAEYDDLVAVVSPAAHKLLKAVAGIPGTRMNMAKLSEVSEVENVGAALQSLSIQCSKLEVPSPIEHRADSNENGRFVYWMSAPTAARILRAMGVDS